jgi:hypothetical protein
MLRAYLNFPPGFTGFYNAGDQWAPPQVDPAQFKTICYRAARELKGCVQDIDFPEIVPNFLRADLEWSHGSERVAVLCNRQYWIVGFCKPPDSCELEYIDCPVLAEILCRLTD